MITQMATIKPSKWLTQRAKAAKHWVWATIFLAMFSGILLIVQANILGRIVDQAYIQQQPLRLLIPLLILFLSIILLRSILAYLRELTSFQAGAKLRAAIRIEILQKIVALGPVYTQAWRSAELSTMVIEQVEALQDYYAKFLPQMTVVILLPLMIVAFIMPYSWLAAIILLVTAPLVPLFMVLIGMSAASLNRKHYQALSRMSVTFLDVLQGLSTLKWFGRSKNIADKVFHVSENYRHTTMSVLRVVFLSSAVLEFFSALAVALLATYLGLSFLHNINVGHWGHDLTLTGALFMLILAPEFYMPLRELNTHYHARAEAIAAAESLIPLLHTNINPLTGRAEQAKLAADPEASTQPLQSIDDHWQIDFNKVTVQFGESHQPALRAISLSIKAGEKIAIVGPSGAGKSTLVNVLMGFVHPTAGELLINHQPFYKLDQQYWRQHIGWLGQSSKLFYGTIRENLAMFKHDASEQDMWLALQYATADTFVRQLPNGLDTLLTEQNQGVSGGQAQCIALARLYLQDAPIWILDEPTASLDSVTEQQMLDNLLVRAQHKTLIVVTHKTDSVKRLGRVVQLQSGVKSDVYGKDG